MALTTAGANAMVAGITGGAPTQFSNATSFIGVGDSATAFSAAQTDLVATTNKMRKAMDSGFPTVSTNVVTFKSTFATTDANWAWNEWGVFNASTAGTMLSRKVEALGTKTSAQSWTFTVTLTFAAA